MTVSWPTEASWALAACSVLALLGFCVVPWVKRKGERWEQYKQGLSDEIEASKTYAEKSRTGTTAELLEAKRILDAKRKALDDLGKAMHLLAAFFTVSVLAGCATQERERIVLLDEHVRIVAPGDVVPDYPEGEARWWLMSPTGLVEMVPQYRQTEF